jgi:hypothetical protein
MPKHPHTMVLPAHSTINRNCHFNSCSNTFLTLFQRSWMKTKKEVQLLIKNFDDETKKANSLMKHAQQVFPSAHTAVLNAIRNIVAALVVKKSTTQEDNNTDQGCNMDGEDSSNGHDQNMEDDEDDCQSPSCS